MAAAFDTLSDASTYLVTREAGAYVNRTPDTLKRWRRENTGPAYIRTGGPHGRVLYARADLDAWVASRRVQPGGDSASPHLLSAEAELGDPEVADRLRAIFGAIGALEPSLRVPDAVLEQCARADFQEQTLAAIMRGPIHPRDNPLLVAFDPTVVSHR